MAEHLLVGTLKRNSAGTAVANNPLSATARRDTALVARLLAHGTDVDTTDAAGNTALIETADGREGLATITSESPDLA